MNHILVTGATGFIGSHLVRELIRLKEKNNTSEDIVCLVRKTSELESIDGLKIKLVIGDLRDKNSLIPAVKGAKYIYHLGAELHTICRQRFLDTNVNGTRNLLEIAKEHSQETLKRFLFVSSQAAAGPATDENPIDETQAPIVPAVSWYGESKMEAEKVKEEFANDIPITTVRPSTVYGERDPGMKQVFNAVASHIHPKTGFKKRFTGMIYAPDLVKGMIAAATNPKTIGETYFLTNPSNYTVIEMVKIMAKGIGKPWGITIPIPIFFFRIIALFSEWFYLLSRKKPLPSRDKVRDLAQVYWLCTPQKAKKDFDWEAQTPLAEGLGKTYNYIKKNKMKMKQMPGETKGLLWFKFFSLSLIMGIIIEALAIFGKVYFFSPSWLVFLVVPLLWGLVFGSIAMWVRTKGFIVQFIPGFIILFAAELLNHYILHNWTFYHFFQQGDTWKIVHHSLFGVENPLLRAVVLGAATGILIPLLNQIMKLFYKLKLRQG